MKEGVLPGKSYLSQAVLIGNQRIDYHSSGAWAVSAEEVLLKMPLTKERHRVGCCAVLLELNLIECVCVHRSVCGGVGG